jgi:hypothetical protein
MTTYLLPVADTEQGAREIAADRVEYGQRRCDWIIRKAEDGFYVVPAGDRGYECVGAFVALVENPRR